MEDINSTTPSSDPQAPPSGRSLAAAIWRFFLRLLVWAIFVFILLNFIFQIPAVQNWAVDRVERAAEEVTGNRVEIDYFYFAFFDRLTLRSVYVEDQNTDTLLQVKEMKVNFNLNPFVLIRKGLVIEGLNLRKAQLNIHRGPGESKSNLDLFMASTDSHTISKKIGPMGGAIRPFVVNGKTTRAFICVNDLLGFEIADIESGKLLHRIEVKGFSKGQVKRHGCPSHGIGLTPDEREIWVVDAANQSVHIFDNTKEPPEQRESIQLREQPGWVTFSLDGAFAYPSTGEVIDVKTKKIIAALTDENSKQVHSEKMLEVHWQGDKVIAVGDQFGVGRVLN